LAALAAGSTLYWVLKWPVSGSAAPQAVLGTESPPIDSDKIALLLGASQPADNDSSQAEAVNVQTNFKLLGVIAQGSGRSGGSALIAVGEQPAKPFRVGQAVADGLVLHSVKPRAALLANSTSAPASVTLALPANLAK
jgi:general secretion pathway protein C